MGNAAQTINEATNLLLAIPAFIFAFIGVMSAISSVLPPPDPEHKFYPFLVKARKIIAVMGCNVKYAKNKDL